MSNRYATCQKGHTRNVEVAPICPICKYGEPNEVLAKKQQGGLNLKNYCVACDYQFENTARWYHHYGNYCSKCSANCGALQFTRQRIEGLKLERRKLEEKVLGGVYAFVEKQDKRNTPKERKTWERLLEMRLQEAKSRILMIGVDLTRENKNFNALVDNFKYYTEIDFKRVEPWILHPVSTLGLLKK